MHLSGIYLLLIGGAAVGIVHSLLPDHWVPLAVVARTQNWSMLRLARVTTLAAGGHVLTSLVLGAVVALVGLQFQKQIETQQGHIVGGVLILTGLGFLIWGLTGHGLAHDHASEHEPGHAHDEDSHHRHSSAHENDGLEVRDRDEHDHQHEHDTGTATAVGGEHSHRHAHAGIWHSHMHSHEAFVRARADLITAHSERGTVLGQLGAIAVPFGVAASPDLTFLPFAIAASAYGSAAVGAVLGVFGVVTMATFVGLTLIATAVGYEMRGEWLEKNANTITSLVLIGIGVVAFFGL